MKYALAVGVLALALLGCGGDNNSAYSGNADAWWDDVLAAMKGAPSYHSEAFIPGDEQTFLWQVDYVAPNSYRLIGRYQEVDSSQSCYVLPPDEQPCEASTPEVQSEGVYETIYLGDKTYHRRCDDINEGCEPWETTDRPPAALAGPSPSYDPGWALVALELATERSIAKEGSGEIELRGTINPLRAILENNHRVLTDAGIDSYGQECSDSAVLPADGTATPEPVTIGTDVAGSTPVGLDCHDLTYEESLEEQEPDLSFYDEHPATLTAFVDAETHLIRRLEITGFTSNGANDEVDEDRTIVFEYTSFGTVTIEAPE